MMADVHTAEQRSRNMAAIRGTNTKPEIIIRSALHRQGFRFRLHRKDLPGRPDIVLPRHHAAIFVNGCFWHGHQCPLFHWPEKRKKFWREKIGDTIKRDAKNRKLPRKEGYRVMTIWECALKGRQKRDPERLIRSVSRWIWSGRPVAEISGKPAV